MLLVLGGMLCSCRSLPVAHACDHCLSCSLAEFKALAVRVPCGPGRRLRVKGWPRVEDAFHLASGARDSGLRASNVMCGESSRPKDTSSCVRRSERKANACRLPALHCQWRLSPISRSSACHVLRRSHLKCVAFTRHLCLFLSAGEVHVHDSHRQDTDQRHLCLKGFHARRLKLNGTDGVFCCTRSLQLKI